MSKAETKVIFTFYTKAEFDFISPYLRHLAARNGFDTRVYVSERYWYGQMSGLDSIEAWCSDNSITCYRDNRVSGFADRLYNAANKVNQRFAVRFSVNKELFFHRLFKRSVMRFVSNPLENLSWKPDIQFVHYRLNSIQAGWEKLNPALKIICSPHCPGILKAFSYKNRVPEYDIAAWLEPSVLSDLPLTTFKDRTLYIGMPEEDTGGQSSDTDAEQKSALMILQKRWNVTGIGKDEALSAIRECARLANQEGTLLYIKHHPKTPEELRSQVSEALDGMKYQEITEFEQIEYPLAFCFSFFSTAPIYFVSKGIPCFMLRPQKLSKQYSDLLDGAFYFDYANSVWTTEYFERDVFYPIDNVQQLEPFLTDKQAISELGEKQLLSFHRYWPKNTNHRVDQLLENLV